MEKLQSGRCELTKDELKFIENLYRKYSKELLDYATQFLYENNAEESL